MCRIISDVVGFEVRVKTMAIENFSSEFRIGAGGPQNIRVRAQILNNTKSVVIR
jgi:hypothetical protein